MSLKRGSLAQLIGIKRVSDSALVSIAKKLREDDCGPVTEKRIYSLVQDVFARAGSIISLPTESGEFKWAVLRLDRVVQLLVEELAPFRALMSEALRASEGGKLDMLFYLDEVCPGNVLKIDNKRKFWALYASFKQFSPHRLCREVTWLPLAAIRTSVVHTIPGGISCVVKLLLRSLFEELKLTSVGFPIMCDDGPALVRVAFGNLIADEAAIKATFMFKGAAGLRPCLLCQNIVSLHSGLDDGAFLHTIACDDPSRFVPSDDHYVWTVHDNLQAAKGRLSRVDFSNLEKASGLTCHDEGLLADVSLRSVIKPASCLVYDFMHNYLVNGVFNIETGCLLSVAKQACGLTYSDFDKFVRASWTWPRSQEKHKVVDIFSSAREKASSDSFRASASECLMVMPILRHIVQTILLRRVPAESKSFLAACDIIDAGIAAKKGSLSRELVTKIQIHLQAHKAAYGECHIKPKFHLGFHTAAAFVRDSYAMDTFVHERKHILLKSIAGNIKHTGSFERSLLTRVLLAQMADLRTAVFNDGLLGETFVETGLYELLQSEDVVVSRSLQHRGAVVSSGDLCFVDGVAGIAKCGLQSQGSLLVVFDKLRPRSTPWPSTTIFEPPADDWYLAVLSAERRLSLAHCWTHQDDGSILALHASS